MNGLNMEVQESHFPCGHLARDSWELENFLDGKGHFLFFFFFLEATFLMAILGSVYMTPCATLFKARGI